MLEKDRLRLEEMLMEAMVAVDWGGVNAAYFELRKLKHERPRERKITLTFDLDSPLLAEIGSLMFDNAIKKFETVHEATNE